MIRREGCLKRHPQPIPDQATGLALRHSLPRRAASAGRPPFGRRRPGRGPLTLLSSSFCFVGRPNLRESGSPRASPRQPVLIERGPPGGGRAAAVTVLFHAPFQELPFPFSSKPRLPGLNRAHPEARPARPPHRRAQHNHGVPGRSPLLALWCLWRRLGGPAARLVGAPGRPLTAFASCCSSRVSAAGPPLRVPAFWCATVLVCAGTAPLN